MRDLSFVQKKLQKIFFLTQILFVFSLAAVDQKTKQINKAALEAGDLALKVSQINSCGTIDRIPWMTKSGGKRTRRIFRDELKAVGEKTYNMWELFQVLRSEGIVSFVFQRTRADGSEEYYAARGDVIERIIEVKKGRRRSVEKQDMKPLINRSAKNFVSKDGSRVEFLPGQTSKSTVIIYPTNDIGVAMAPLYLKGISCDKPESFSDDDVQSKDLGPASKEKSPATPPGK